MAYLRPVFLRLIQTASAAFVVVHREKIVMMSIALRHEV